MKQSLNQQNLNVFKSYQQNVNLFLLFWYCALQTKENIIDMKLPFKG